MVENLKKQGQAERHIKKGPYFNRAYLNKLYMDTIAGLYNNYKKMSIKDSEAKENIKLLCIMQYRLCSQLFDDINKKKNTFKLPNPEILYDH